MAYDDIELTRDGAVAILQMDRPKALNALNLNMMQELADALSKLEADDTVGCVILTGSEKAFAAGADIKDMAEDEYLGLYKNDRFEENHMATERFRKPIIAAVAGYALGGGCEVAMMCDFIIAADNAKFGQPEINLGVMPGMGGTQRMLRAVGKAKTMDLCLTGRMMDAEEAERAGLVAPRSGNPTLRTARPHPAPQDRRTVVTLKRAIDDPCPAPYMAQDLIQARASAAGFVH